MNGDQARQQQTQRGDDLAAHGFGDQRALAVNAKLKHGVGQSLNHGAWRNAEYPGDLFGGEPLCDRQNKLQLTRRKATAEVAFPCTVYDCRFHDVFSVVFPLHPVAQVQQ